MVKGWKKIFQANRAGAGLSMSDETDFKPKLTIRDREGYYILMEGRILQGVITILNIYTPNPRAPKVIKETLYS